MSRIPTCCADALLREQGHVGAVAATVVKEENRRFGEATLRARAAPGGDSALRFNAVL